MTDGEIPLCPEVGRDTLYNLLKVDNNFPSLVPAQFGLTIPEGKHSQSEGFVIRPLDGEKYIKFSQFSVYFNTPRLESVLSKLGEFTWKDFAKIAGLLVVDAKEEFEQDNDILLKDGDFWNKAKKSISDLSGEVVREHLKKYA